jgi:hypothetical protein
MTDHNDQQAPPATIVARPIVGLLVLVAAVIIVAGFSPSCARGFREADAEAPVAERLRAGRKRTCERVNSECSLSCGTPEIVQRRIENKQTPAYIGTYVRCAAACGRSYEACLKRITEPESARESGRAR